MKTSHIVLNAVGVVDILKAAKDSKIAHLGYQKEKRVTSVINQRMECKNYKNVIGHKSA